MLWLVVAVWLVCVGFSYYNGRTTLPIMVFILGALNLVGIFFFGTGGFGVAAQAILAIVILLSLKLDFARTF